MSKLGQALTQTLLGVHRYRITVFLLVEAFKGKYQCVQRLLITIVFLQLRVQLPPQRSSRLRHVDFLALLGGCINICAIVRCVGCASVRDLADRFLLSRDFSLLRGDWNNPVYPFWTLLFPTVSLDSDFLRFLFLDAVVVLCRSLTIMLSTSPGSGHSLHFIRLCAIIRRSFRSITLC